MPLDMDNFLLTKTVYSKDPIDHYISSHSLRYTPEQLELLEHVKQLPGKKKSVDEQKFCSNRDR